MFAFIFSKYNNAQHTFRMLLSEYHPFQVHKSSCNLQLKFDVKSQFYIAIFRFLNRRLPRLFSQNSAYMMIRVRHLKVFCSRDLIK